jgi:hypothetical protein
LDGLHVAPQRRQAATAISLLIIRNLQPFSFANVPQRSNRCGDAIHPLLTGMLTTSQHCPVPQNRSTCRPRRPCSGDAPTVPTISRTDADHLADHFVAWMHNHGLSERERTVDDVWWLASEDFAPALDVTLPPRRMFLGALQGCFGVTVTYDRRVGRPVNGKQRKTTIYTFAKMPVPMKAAA